MTWTGRLDVETLRHRAPVAILAVPDAFLRTGLEQLLEHGGWTCTTGTSTAFRADLSVIDLTDGAAPDQLATLPPPGAVPRVAIVTSGDADEGARALKSGASAIVTRRCSPRSLLRTAEAVVEGQCVLPSALARRVVRRAEHLPREPPLLEPHEVDWLRILVAGGSVTELAAMSGYSERSMFRRLRELYRRIGASNRLEAAIVATRSGHELLVQRGERH